MMYARNKPPIRLNEHAQSLLDQQAHQIHVKCDRVFAVLLILEWLAGIGCAVLITPRTWIGETSTVHLHVWAAIILGGVIVSLPLYLVWTHAGSAPTRQTIAIAQMLYSAMLIHLTGGRIETHFHIFGSLAFLAFYRDWRVLLTGTMVVVADHFLRGMFWSESVFGVAYSSHWRWAEHAGWVVFEDAFLFMACFQGRKEMTELAQRQAEITDSGIRRNTKLKMAIHERDDLLAALDSGVIMVTTDAQRTINSVNDRFCEISGYSREELIGQSPRIVDSEYHPQSFWADMHRSVDFGAVWRGEVRNRAKDGRIYWVDTTIKGILGQDGKLLKVVAIQHDITDRKTAVEQLHQAQRLESIGQLAAGIAHEINTPTQYVGDNVRFLQANYGNLLQIIERLATQLDPTSPPLPWLERKEKAAAALNELDFAFVRTEIPKAINESLEGLGRVTAIVRAMKDFSHPGSELKEPADLNRAIASTVEVCRARWKYVAELQTEFATDLPSVPCYVAEFNQVILNLVVNAADAISEKFGLDGSQKGRIVVSTRLLDDSVEIRVRDNGPGIPEKVKQKLFEPFFTTKALGKGTGQGLTLSRGVIVNKHGGDLRFEPAEDGGAVFVICLPLVDPESSRLKAA